METKVQNENVLDTRMTLYKEVELLRGSEVGDWASTQHFRFSVWQAIFQT